MLDSKFYANVQNNTFNDTSGIYVQLVMQIRMATSTQVCSSFIAVCHVEFMLVEEWLDVMNDIIGGLKDKNQFPEWYEGLHRALFRANEFLGNNKVKRNQINKELI